MTHRQFEQKELDPEQEASDQASYQIFNWYLNSGNGVPQEKAWHDEWVSCLWDPKWNQDHEAEYSSSSSEDDEKKKVKYNSERQVQVQSWVDSVQL